MAFKRSAVRTRLAPPNYVRQFLSPEGGRPQAASGGRRAAAQPETPLANAMLDPLKSSQSHISKVDTKLCRKNASISSG